MKFDRENVDIAWCPGCGDFLVLRSLKQALEELGFEPQNTVLVSGIGQAAKTVQYVNANFYNGLHGRALPAATAIKASNKDLNVIVVSGDGDIYGEGGNHFIQTIRRNPNITLLVCNNMIYGLTKGQPSPTSEADFITRYDPEGLYDYPFNPIAASLSQNVSFAARAFCQDIEKTKDIIKEAILHKGFSLVDIFQPCVTYNHLNTYQWFKERVYYLEEPLNQVEAFSKALETDKLPIGIFYKEDRTTFEDNRINLKKTQKPLYQNNVDLEKLREKIVSFI